MKDKIATVTLNPAIDETIVISNFSAHKVNRVESIYRNAGGKGINVASYISDYGLESIATGFLGLKNEKIFTTHFSGKKIKDQFIRINGYTRTGIKIMDPIQSETTDINYPGLSPGQDQIQQLKKIISRLTGQCNWFVLAGSLPAKVEPQLYGELIAILKKNHCQVLLDTSGQALKNAVSHKPDIIKPNLEELSGFAGQTLSSDQSIIRVCRHLIEQGLKMVVVSMGEKGALFVQKDIIIKAAPPRVKPVTTVGAGDALVAGLICGLQNRQSLSEAARLATAFSVHAVTQIKTGIMDKNRLEQAMELIKIELFED